MADERGIYLRWKLQKALRAASRTEEGRAFNNALSDMTRRDDLRRDGPRLKIVKGDKE
jgi:hypothetical protein